MQSKKSLVLYNTKSRQKEDFKPISAGHVGIYSCGPTVYSTQHVGNLRAAFVVDLLKRVLRDICDFQVTHIMNITDVGHLTGDNEGDASQGEDRMEKWARTLGVTAWEVAAKYTNIYLDDLAALGIEATTDMSNANSGVIAMPKATDHIQEQIDMIKSLEDNGHTYVIEGDGVYMDTATMDDFGVLLSEKHLEGIQEWARVQAYGKINPTDFALWKFNTTGKKRDMEWDSPWGTGFPGWHIECSAMATKYLGKHFDIHTGGMEHIAVHHTNEIAQAECSVCKTPWVNYWLHYQRLMMNGEKIAKSTGNVAYISEVLDRGYTGEDMRYFYCTGHYRSFHDFTWEAVDNAAKARQKIIAKIAQTVDPKEYSAETDTSWELYETLIVRLLDDLDTVWVLATMHSALKWTPSKEDCFALFHIDEVLWLWLLAWVRALESEKKYSAPQEILLLAEKRWEAKQQKDYTTADALRRKIDDAWWTMADHKDYRELLKNT